MENFTSNMSTHGGKLGPDSHHHEVGAWYWVLGGVICFIILAGNGLTIYLIVTCRRLHAISNWLILSLSLADLFVGLFLVPVSTSCVLWLTSCNFLVMSACFDLLLFVSIGNMCAMTADRYLFMVRPLTYFQNMTNSRVLQWIVAAWVIPIVFSLIPFAWIFSKSFKERETEEMIYGAIQVISFNIFPCVTMLLVYAHIFIISQKHSRQIRALTVNQRTEEPEALSRRQTRQERSATTVFGFVLLFFLLCWLLSAYRHICRYFKLSCHISFGTVTASRLLMILNSAINPFIYAFLKKDIKREVKNRLCRRKITAESF